MGVVLRRRGRDLGPRSLLSPESPPPRRGDRGAQRRAAPAGSFTASLAGLRTTWNFSRAVLLTAYGQVNSDSDVTSVSARFRWMWRPGSDLYLVYNRATGKGLEKRTWQLMLKATWAILP